jgi:benzoyl-CoA reductase subunit C
VQARGAAGVIFCAPSFCDPALLDRPMLARALDERGISHISMKYSENTGQFQTTREQAGTFADSLKLWSEA